VCHTDGTSSTGVITRRRDAAQRAADSLIRVAVEPSLPTPAPAGRVVRWGLPDFLIAWVAGVVAGALAASPVSPAANAPRRDQVTATVVALLVQSVVSVAAVVWVSRTKGRGSLAADFGLTWNWRDTPWVGMGVVLAVVATQALYPLSQLLPKGHRTQDIVDTFKASSGLATALFVIGVLVLAPTVEELLFRGVLLRALLRRVPPGPAIVISGLVFALVHPLLDPTLGTLVAVPALFALGLLSGYQAARTGRLSRSIALHVGFNALTVIAVLANR
jgi:membrane protease YdiL (CAAX protease family)